MLELHTHRNINKKNEVCCDIVLISHDIQQCINNSALPTELQNFMCTMQHMITSGDRCQIKILARFSCTVSCITENKVHNATDVMVQCLQNKTYNILQVHDLLKL